MLKLIEKKRCCGCSSCYNICPTRAIVMEYDSEGFLYPTIDETKCSKCGLCVYACPVKSNIKDNNLMECYGAKNKNVEEQSNSSSGGIFPIFANYVLDKGGVVFGAGFDEKWKVVHKYIEDKKDLWQLSKSKYVQSDIGETYKQAEQFLEKKRLVLFTGTPCQIAGLIGFLQKNYDNLITIDLICFQVASPKVWEKCLSEEVNINDIKSIDFRDKTYSWDKSITRIYLKNGKYYPRLPFIYRFVSDKVKNWLYLTNYSFSYRKGCLSGLFSRPSCYNCNFKGNRSSDFTVGDLWGADIILPEIYDKKGVSVLVVNSQKAKSVFKQIKDEMQYRKINFFDMVKRNPYYVVSAPMHYRRDDFFKNYKTKKLKRLIPYLLEENFIVTKIIKKIVSKFL